MGTYYILSTVLAFGNSVVNERVKILLSFYREKKNQMYTYSDIIAKKEKNTVRDKG